MAEFNFTFSGKIVEMAINGAYVIFEKTVDGHTVTVRLEDPVRKAVADKAKEEAAAEEARKEAEKEAKEAAAAEKKKTKEENFERFITDLEEYTRTKRDTWVSPSSDTPVWQDSLYSLYVRKIGAGSSFVSLDHHMKSTANAAFSFFKVLPNHVH